MTFTSQFFLFGFLPAVLAVHLVAPRRARLAILTLASFAFCAWASPVFALPLAAITLIDYACGRVIAAAPESAATRRRLAVAASLVANLGLLVAFKYLGFLGANLDALLARLGLARTGLADALHLALPLGLSFYAFQSLGYVIDVYHRRAAPARSLLEYACFLSFFPRLAAGPILRFKEFAPQLRAPAVGLASFSRGALTFSLGLAKKVLLANPCGTVADFAFGAGALAAGDAWLGLLAYALQIYFDFSGYTDMAIGLGLLFGLELPQNFDRPYLARSITEFWRRWHITLSNWLRDFLFLPIAYAAGRRFERLRLAPAAEEYASYTAAALATMALAGLWHGAAWNFVIWGVIHGTAMTVERAVGRKRLYRLTPDAAKRAVTFAVVLFAWVFFRTPDLHAAGRYLASLAGAGAPLPGGELLGGVLYQPYLLLSVGAAAAVTWAGRPTRLLVAPLTAGRAALALALLWLGLAVLFAQAYKPFLYSVF